MALAARSSRAGTPSDGRIPCPVCRQQIHPVAGRCKHCKTDLVKLREQQGIRATRVAPAMLGAPAPAPMPFAPAAPAPATARLSGQMAVPTIVSPTSQTLLDPPPYALPQVQAIDAPPALPLPGTPGTPPYLYDESPVEAAPARRARWPIFVAIGAGIAIVICILLLVLDDKPAKSSRTTNGVGMGTDSMDTDVAPPPPVDLGKPGDPWGDPTTPDPTPPPDLQPDPYQPPPPTPPPSTFNGTIPKAEDFYGTMIKQVCEKAMQCSGAATGGMADLMDSLCDGGADLFGSVMSDQLKNGQCSYDEDAAGRCLAQIGSMSCTGSGSGSLDSILSGASDCMTALSCSY